jgi:hypothetical protein
MNSHANHGPERNCVVHLEVAGALDAEALGLMIRLANSTIRSGCAELVLQLHALTDFPTRLFTELHRLDQTARRHQCPLQLLGLHDAVTALLGSSQEVGEPRPTPSVPAEH